MPRFARLLAIAFPLALTGPSAHADVVISVDATQNMACSGGVCAPTTADAVLNVSDLQDLLASGNLSVVTTNGGVQANNIDIVSEIDCTCSGSLTLDAYQSVPFDAIVRLPRTGGVALLTNDGGSGGALTFAIGKGQLSFANDSNPLSINGNAYQLVSSVQQLAIAIVAKRDGRFALSRDTNAGKEGVYNDAPIPKSFAGSFNGLGHAISNLKIVAISVGEIGLFRKLNHGSIASLSLRNALVRGAGWTGALASVNYFGAISNSFVSGKIFANYRGSSAGGLVGFNMGTLSTSQSMASVEANIDAGGIAADNGGTVAMSFATGRVSGARVGGLVGANFIGANVENSYALGGLVIARRHPIAGGFTGYNDGSISVSYSTGAVSGAERKASVGGFDGRDVNTISNCYWDTDTSGTDMGSGDGNEAGLTGLTTDEFESGLPTGFDPAIWAEDSSINNGFPYLIANPPND